MKLLIEKGFEVTKRDKKQNNVILVNFYMTLESFHKLFLIYKSS